MKKEKAEIVVEIMEDLRDLKYDLNHWDKASFYKEGDNAHVYAGGCGVEAVYLCKYITFGTLKATVVPIIEKRIYDLERELNNI